ELSPHLEAVSPMVYPSHYSDGWLGYPDPNVRPYEVTARALDDALPRVTGGAVLRPWLQAFSWSPSQIREAIRAAEERGVGWMLWNVGSSFDPAAIPTDEDLADEPYDRRMLIGVQLPEVERPVTWPEIREVALVAESCGLDSVWVGDHLLYRDDGESRGPYEAWSLLAALAEATERVSLGPLVASVSFHAPAMLAKKAATVDDISGGRLILGLGAGWNRVEYDAFGFPFDNRVDRFEEAFTIIRTLLREGSMDFEGRYHTVRESELIPKPRPDIPIM